MKAENQVMWPDFHQHTESWQKVTRACEFQGMIGWFCVTPCMVADARCQSFT